MASEQVIVSEAIAKPVAGAARVAIQAMAWQWLQQKDHIAWQDPR